MVHSVHSILKGIAQHGAQNRASGYLLRIAVDKRQFDHMQKLAHDITLKAQQNKITTNLLYGGGEFIFAAVALLFTMSFFGDEHQSQLASNLLEKLMTALSGVGIYLLGKSAISKLTTFSSE